MAKDLRSIRSRMRLHSRIILSGVLIMTFGESANSFFWQGYYESVYWSNMYQAMDMWATYCMGGEL